MGQEILTTKQKQVIDIVSQEKNLADFYLSGGTALAGYYFQHRISDDLDFFAAKEPDKIFLHSFAKKIQQIIQAESLRFERLYDRNIFFFKFGKEELKIEFTKYPFSQLEKLIIKDDVKIDSLRDIAANKLMAILHRFDPKDFVDLFFILKKFKLENIRQDVEKKFGIKVDDIFLGGELSKVRHIKALPKMLKPATIKEVKDFIVKQVKNLEPVILQ